MPSSVPQVKKSKEERNFSKMRSHLKKLVKVPTGPCGSIVVLQVFATAVIFSNKINDFRNHFET
jgi:hypothetical protein